MQLLVR